MPRCLHHKTKFVAKYFNQKFCMEDEDCIDASIQYARDKVKAKQTKDWQKEKKVLKTALKTKSDYEKDLQKEVNTIVRLIDKGFVCISTGKPLNDKFDAGHFYSRGANATLRFNLFNIYAQSVYANQYLSGDQTNFISGLRQHYGNEHAEYVLSLKSITVPLKLTNDDLKEKTAIARGIVKWLKLQEKTFDAKERIELRLKFNNELGIYKK